MAKYSGRRGRVYVASTGSGTPTAVLGVSKWSLDLSQDTIETTEFGDTNKTYIPALRDVTGSFEGFWNDAETKLFAGAQSDTGAFLYLYPDLTNAPTKYAYGPAWLSVQMETDVADAVKMSVDYAANGQWGFSL